MLAGLFSTSVAQAPEAFPVQKGTVEFRKASKSYGDHRVLNSIDLQVAAGEVVAVCGPSGSGKSTLIRLINQLETLTDGEILVDGKPTRHLKGHALRNLRRHVGFVFQQFNLYAHLNALENITLALTRIHGKSAAQAQAIALSLLERVGLKEKAGHFPSQLSGGQQQRVALARALALSPGLLLLDEPLSALDAKVRVHLRDEICKLQRKLGITTIMVTHDQDEALSMADRIVVMNHGVIEQVGTPQEIYHCLLYTSDAADE